MWLFYIEASPFTRKVRVLAAEKNIKLKLIIGNPSNPDKELLAANPLGQIPALILDNGQVLIDSWLICQYLDTIPAECGRLIPDTENRWEVQNDYFLADGIVVAAVKIAYERRRPVDKQFADEIEKQKNKIIRTLELFEPQIKNFSQQKLNIFYITLGCALGYLDLRIPDLKWRDSYPKLAQWYKEFSMRPSMLETAPDKTPNDVLKNDVELSQILRQRREKAPFLAQESGKNSKSENQTLSATDTDQQQQKM